MTLINMNPSFTLGAIKSDRETVTFGANGTWAYGTLLARDTVSSKLVVFVKGGSTNGNGIAARIVLDPNGITKTGGAGDLTSQLVYKGGDGVRLDKLIIAADGNSSNIDAGVIAQLHDAGIYVEEVKDFTVVNNF